MDSAVTRWRGKKKKKKNGSLTPSRFTNGPPSWILMDQFPLTTIYTVPKAIRDTATARGDYGYVSVPGIKMLRGFYYPLPFLPLPLSSFLSPDFCLSRSRFRSFREPVSLITPRSFIIRRTLKNARRVFVLFLLLTATTAHDYKYKWKGFDVWNRWQIATQLRIVYFARRVSHR